VIRVYGVKADLYGSIDMEKIFAEFSPKTAIELPGT